MRAHRALLGVGLIGVLCTAGSARLLRAQQTGARPDSAAIDAQARRILAQADSLRVTGDALVTLRQWTFLLGPGLIAGINALFLGYVMYRGRLVPRIIPTIGLIGAPIIITSAIVTIFGGWAQTSGTAFVFGLLDVIWEFSLGVYLTFKGFKQVPAAVTDN